MAPFTLVAFSLALAWAAFQTAGVTPDWNWSLCGIGITSAMYFAASLWNPPEGRRGKLVAWLLVAFAAIPAIQVAPLPTWLIAILSPARAALLRESAIVLNSPVPRWSTLSVTPSLTYGYVLTIAAYVLVFLVMREIAITFRDRSWTWAPVWPIVIIAALEGALGFSQTFADNSEGFARGTYASRDHFAGLLELALPFAVLYPFAILYRDRKPHESPAMPAVQACAVLAAAAAIFVGIALSLSRMAFLAALASLLVSGGLALSLRDVHPNRAPWRKWLPVATVGAAVILAFIFLPSDALISRFAELPNTDTVSSDTRAQIWRETIKLVKAFPILGCGFGGYESAFLRYKTVAPMFTVNYAHNDYLQVLAEAGIVGFAIGMSILFLVLRAAAQGAKRAIEIDERLLSVACLASLTAILLHSAVDFNMYVPANGLVVAWIAGIAFARQPLPKPRPARKTAPAAAHV